MPLNVEGRELSSVLGTLIVQQHGPVQKGSAAEPLHPFLDLPLLLSEVGGCVSICLY